MLSTFQARLAPGVNVSYQPGFYRRTYSGYFGGTTTWFDTATLTATNKIVGSIADAAIPTTTSYQFLGYFKAPYSETFTFTLASDDKSNLWIGSNAVSGYNGGNTLIKSNVDTNSNTIVMVAGQLYAVRLQVGNGPGPGSVSLSVQSSSLALTSDLTQLCLFNPNTLGI